MASKWFEGLSGQAQGFLVASLLFRSKEHDILLSYLNPSDSVALKERAASILQLERGQRVRLLIAELRRLLSTSSQPWILAVDPSWIAEILKKEERAIQRCILSVFPKSVAKTIGTALNFTSAQIDKLEELPAPVATAVRRALEKELTPMRAISFDPVLNVSQLLMLTKSELEILIIQTGKNVLATSMKSETSALKTLSIEESGLRRFAILLANENGSMQREVAQRLEFPAGQKLLKYIKVLKQSPDEVTGERVDLEIFSLIIELARMGRIDERFGKCFLPK